MEEVCEYIANNFNIDENDEICEYIMLSDDDEYDMNYETGFQYSSFILRTCVINHIITHLNIYFGEEITEITSSDSDDIKVFVSFIYKNRKCMIEDYYSSRGYSYWIVTIFPVW